LLRGSSRYKIHGIKYKTKYKIHGEKYKVFKGSFKNELGIMESELRR